MYKKEILKISRKLLFVIKKKFIITKLIKLLSSPLIIFHVIYKKMKLMVLRIN